jgi:tetraacyldisaccharide 4'-kinase
MPLYAAGLAVRNLRIEHGWEPVRRLRFPVVSIGNLSTGGAGKTPFTIALAKTLMLRGLRVDVLSRGYGRKGQRPARVDPNGTSEEFGDEPLLIARQAGVPVYVGRQRYEAGLLAETEAPDTVSSASAPIIHLLDDGFQHRQLYRDIDILLLDSRDGRDSLLPAGNLREPLKAARRATVIAIPAQDDAPKLEAALRGWGFAGPVWRLHRRMEVPAPLGSEAGPVAAFCGIARPEQFFSGLEAAGLQLVFRLAFPDHHHYTPAELQRFKDLACEAGATAFITTEKDHVRLGPLSASFPDSPPLKIASLRIEIEQEDEAIDWLVGRLSSALPHPSL